MVETLQEDRITGSRTQRCDRVPETVSPDRTTDAVEKKRLFDHYWETRDLSSADMRTRLRISLVESLLEHRFGRLLDVGCGRGAIAAHFAERGWMVTATDIAPLAVEWTRRQHRAIAAVCLDLETEPIPGEYDVALCLEVLQQVRNPVDVLRKLAASLTDEGELIVSLPNEFHVARRLAIGAGRVNFGGIDDTHIKLYTVAEHARLFAACGLEDTARRVQSIVPPRWAGGRWHTLANRVARLFPGLFALSVVYRLKPAPRSRPETRG
ncbi:MAG TPA: class I SAM-dependent methyltransferase [Acidobacteriota bacterium]|nr:class I SAM-dependent methyltransferase [Acidobacteriota bacterium]